MGHGGGNKFNIDSSVYFEKLPRDPRASLIVILYPNRHRLMIECGHSLVGLRLRGRAPIHTGVASL
jgi:hypothetical protein